jgi:uncharacterized membrane protein YjjB (DUF3815 family)
MSAVAVKQQSSRAFGAIVIWGLSYIAARFALDAELNLGPAWLRVVAALLPVVPTALALHAIAAGLREADELQRRVHLEALAIAYPLAILLLMTLGLLELAVGLSPQDWSYRHTWIYLPLFYFVGLWLAWRRYR